MEKAALAAAEIQLNYFQKFNLLNPEEKQPKDFVTEADKKSEARIIEILKKDYPNYGFIGEESGESKEKAEFKFIIDPLDGTINFMKGLPFFCISIALADFRENDTLTNTEQIKAGLIYAPYFKETYYAERSKGAYFNANPVEKSERTDQILSSIGNKGFNTYVDDYPNTHELIQNTAHKRFLGAAALELAYVAIARFDSFIHFCLNDWDMAAAAVILEEAGYRVEALDESKNIFKTKNIMATV